MSKMPARTSAPPVPRLIERPLEAFRKAWRLGTGLRDPFKGGLDPELGAGNEARLRARIDACLEAKGGEVSARERAAELGEAYLTLNRIGKRRFLKLLAREYDIDKATVDTAIDARQATNSVRARRTKYEEIGDALVPTYITLLKQFNGLHQGIKFLVDFRADVIEAAREAPEISQLDADLRKLLASWFDVGFLKLRRIVWDTPASVLERIKDNEAVHEIRSWEDLKNRVDADRRCYAFFHPNMEDEPLIFVEVALVKGMSASVQSLLDPSAPLGNPDHADCAIFYSISKCQRGLEGVSFGSFLIKRVATDLASDLPNLKTFATLSPLPDFRRWLKGHIERGSRGVLGDSDSRALTRLAGSTTGLGGLGTLLDRPGWHEDDAVSTVLRPILIHLAVRYLTRARRHGHAFDRVAHFHLTNGARVERLNWLADTSERGLQDSAGLMVNYRYNLAEVEHNHEAYSRGKVAASTAVKRAARRRR